MRSPPTLVLPRRTQKLADGLTIEKLFQLGVIGKETAYPKKVNILIAIILT
jgi:hypothetical protein